MMLSIAIIDTIGLAYDGSTLSKKGLGGSESAVILMAKELSKIGFKITVYNNCEDKDCFPGFYDKVEYLPLTNIQPRHFDIIISSRTIIPFIPEELYHMFQPDQYGRFHDCKSFKNLTSNHKILWKHDTFCMGDHILEDLVINNYIDEIFTLSDFHTTYITNSEHGKKRNYEVLKNKVFQTRNGIVNYIPEVDIQQKDPTHFVFNASISKGMVPLVTKIWPKIKQNIPQAKLTVIGGYYRFRENAQPDEQEIMFHDLVSKTEYQDINFTGIITQKEIANILSNASYFVYPAIFPETFGISTLESLNYNTPLITTRFGALEETAIDDISYFIDYAVEPTPLSPWINSEQQIDKFVNKVMDVYTNPYLHQQKMYQCNIVKPISTWDTIALQWKQHFYKIFKLHLTKEDFQKVSKINQQVKEIFGRRISNKEDFTIPKKSVEQKFVFIVPTYNSEKYINKTILSVGSQNYENYECIIINDCSDDLTLKVIEETITHLDDNTKNKFTVINNTIRQGAVRNQIDNIRKYNDEDIIILLDGDDQLYNDNSLLDYYNDLYDGSTEFTYGSCWSQADNIPLIAQPYPKEIRDNKSYRSHKFNWGIPYTHLRTFKKKLLNDIPDSEFQDENGNWFMAGGDNATFYSIIEQADPDKIKAVSKITCFYNDINPLNDYKVNCDEQNKTAQYIQNKGKELNIKKKKILIAIPTAKYIEPETFKSIYDLEIPDGYETYFQFFHGYNIAQIRTLIADWMVNGNYDFLFSVDSDISFAPDTLEKLLTWNVDMVSGIYRQRLEPQILEIYKYQDSVKMYNASYEELKSAKTIEDLRIAACGFGCVLVKKDVFVQIDYPQFEYHNALNHQNTLSEDVDFCMKATAKGFKIYCDPTILCDHIGSSTFKVT